MMRLLLAVFRREANYGAALLDLTANPIFVVGPARCGGARGVSTVLAVGWC